MSTEEALKPVEVLINSGNPSFVLTFQQLIHFLEIVHGSPDKLSTARQYTDNVPKLLEMLSEIYPHLQLKGIKSRFTRIQKSITKQLENERETEDSETDMDLSQGDTS